MSNNIRSSVISAAKVVLIPKAGILLVSISWLHALLREFFHIGGERETNWET
jgi:hypothetical protein